MLLRRSPRAALAWMAAVAVATVTAGLVATDLAAIHRRARDSGHAVPVVVANRDLSLGTIVGVDDVDVGRQFARLLPPEAISSPDDAVGRVVTTPVLAGTVVTHRHLASRERSGLDGIVPPGMRAVRVVTEEGIRPSPGSVVDVLVSFDPVSFDLGGEPTLVVVRGALVLAADEGGNGDGGLLQGRQGVTVLTDPDGARRLAFAAANGVVTLVLAPPEDACCPAGT